MTAWLKVIGTSKSPLRDDWGSHAPALLHHATFAKRPGGGSFVPGDDIVYYALRGDISRLVAIGEVTSEPWHESARERDPGWPWLVDIDIAAKRQRISEGFPLELLNVDRDLRRSVQRRSHIRLRSAELERARQLFGGR